jgi:hypothetical protein
MKKWAGILIAFVMAGGLRAQSNGINCSRKSDTWLNKYRKQETYIPSSTDPVKTVHCQLIIWQKDDGSGTWDQHNPDHMDRLRSMIDLINLFWSNAQGPSDTIPGVVPLGYSNIEFEIGLKFYQNSFLYDHGGRLCSNFDTLNKAAVKLDLANANYLNIHLVGCACNAGGCTNMLGSHRFGDQTILMNSNHAATTDDWDDARNIAHELGHALGLAHLYNGTGPDEEPCSNANIDFLADAMFPASVNGCAPGKGCTHCYNPGGSCDPYASNTDLCDNNIMGGSTDYKYLSPLQVGRCHRTLAVTNMSKYTTGYSNTPWIISENETWDFEIKLYQDLVIEPGTTLEIKGKVYMVDNAGIIVKPGAVLIVDGGMITNGGNTFPGSNGLWKEIRVWNGKVKTRQDQKKIYRKGEVVLKNGGTIEKCCKGINYFKQ